MLLLLFCVSAKTIHNAVGYQFPRRPRTCHGKLESYETYFYFFSGLFQLINWKYRSYSAENWNSLKLHAFSAVTLKLYLAGNRCILVTTPLLSVWIAVLPSMYRKLVDIPHHAFSVSEWDWMTLTSLDDFLVMLMVTSLICSSFPWLPGDSIKPTVIYFQPFPQSHVVCLDNTNMGTAKLTGLSTHLCHFPQWKNPPVNWALFT